MLAFLAAAMAMSPEAVQAVQSLIEASDKKVREDLNTHIDGDGEAVKREIQTHRN